jgi:hypothetical protein
LLPVRAQHGGMTDFSPEDLRLHHKITELHCVPGLPFAAGTVRSVDLHNTQYVS